ncbi:unnamed protein product [Caenorhabditis auriculariae]|uniref:Uncharacterized protein n=1 Tax=Caenorhabditis auriculariae TaxID=2777116 RepID=A0A8S1GNA0_9PELO|nr:unnamed protein product [Caenorhabditis auriculariae]
MMVYWYGGQLRDLVQELLKKELDWSPVIRTWSASFFFTMLVFLIFDPLEIFKTRNRHRNFLFYADEEDYYDEDEYEDDHEEYYPYDFEYELELLNHGFSDDEEELDFSVSEDEGIGSEPDDLFFDDFFAS